MPPVRARPTPATPEVEAKLQQALAQEDDALEIEDAVEIVPVLDVDSVANERQASGRDETLEIDETQELTLPQKPSARQRASASAQKKQVRTRERRESIRSISPVSRPPRAPRTKSIAPVALASSSLSRDPYSQIQPISHAAQSSLEDQNKSARELVELCEENLKSEQVPSRRARLHYEIARLNESALAQTSVALSHFQKAHSLDASFEPSIAGLIRVRSHLGQWEGTLPLYDEQVALTAKAEDQAGLYYCKAIVLEMRLDRPADARSAYERALSLVPDEISLLRAVARAARREKDWVRFHEVVGVQAQNHGEDKNWSSARFAERARVAEVFRKDASSATENYRSAFDCDPLASAAVLALNKLYGESESYRHQVALLAERARLMSAPSARAAAYASAGAIASESMDEPQEALKLYEMAWEAEPDNILHLNPLEVLYRKVGNFEGVFSVLERIEQRTVAEEARAYLCVAIAELLHRRLDRLDDAIRYWEKARALAPALSSCVEPLIVAYESRESWEQLILVLSEEEAASEDSVRRAAIHCHLAQVQEHHLSSVDLAIDHFRAALGLVPADEGAFRDLSRLLEQVKRYEELVELHERAAEGAPTDEVAFVHLFKVGQILETLLGAPLRALPAYRAILRRDQANLGAFFALQRAAHSAGEYAVLVDALTQEAEFHQSKARKSPLLHRAASICLIYLGQEQRALDLENQVVQLDASYGPSLDALSKLHRSAGRYPDLLKILEFQMKNLELESERAALFYQMGVICEEKTGDDEEALSYFKKALELDKENAPAIVALERTLARLGLFDELASFLHNRLKSHEAGSVRAELALRLGCIYEMRLKNQKKALASYNQALEDIPHWSLALDAKIRVLESLKEPKLTAATLAELASSASDASLRLWAQLRRAELIESLGGKSNEAIPIYEKILEEHAGHPLALSALERLNETQKNRDELVRILNLQVASFQSVKNQRGVLRDLVRLEEELPIAQLENKKKAARGLGHSQAADALLSRSADDRPALRRAELVALDPKVDEALATVDRHFANISTSPQLAASHRTRLAEFLEPRNAVQALEQHRPALVLDPENMGSARGVSRISQVVDDPALLLEAAELEANVTRHSERSARLFVRAAHLLVEKGSEKEAISSLQRALTVYPESRHAGQKLYQVLYPLARFDELCGTLTAAAQACATPEAASEHWLAVAKILADEKNDLPAATAALKRVEKAGVQSLVLLVELGELFLRDRQWSAAAERFIHALELRPEPALEIQVRLRVAETQHEHLGKSIDASRQLRDILRIEPTHRAANRRLLAIQMKEKSPAALETAQLLAEIAAGPERGEAMAALGSLLLGSGKNREAVAPYEEAVSLIGMQPPEAYEGLNLILEKENAGPKSWAGYARALEKFAANEEPGEHQACVLFELARILGKKQLRQQDAIVVLSAGIKQNPEVIELRVELVNYLRAEQLDEDALREVFALLALAPLRGETWSEIVGVFGDLGKNAEATIATGPLFVLNQASDLQRSAWTARKPQAALLAEGAFDASLLQSLSAFGGSDEAVALLAQLAGPLAKVFPPQLAQWGANSRMKVSAGGIHACRPVLDRLCHCFGELEIDLYPSESATQVTTVLTDPVGLVVPASIGGLSDLQQVCYLGCHVANIARGTHVVDALPASEFELLIAGALSMVGAQLTQSSVAPATASEFGKKLVKALPWLSKGRFEDAVRRFAQAAPPSAVALREQLQMSALRAGLVLADDLSPIIGLSNGRAELLGIEAAAVHRLVEELFLYWASSEAMELRRRLGMLA